MEKVVASLETKEENVVIEESLILRCASGEAAGQARAHACPVRQCLGNAACNGSRVMDSPPENISPCREEFDK